MFDKLETGPHCTINSYMPLIAGMLGLRWAIVDYWATFFLCLFFELSVKNCKSGIPE